MRSRSPECRAVVRLLLPSGLFDRPESSSSSWSSWKFNDFRWKVCGSNVGHADLFISTLAFFFVQSGGCKKFLCITDKKERHLTCVNTLWWRPNRMGHIHLRGKWRPRTPRWYNAALTHTKWMGNLSSPTSSSNCENRRASFCQTSPGMHVWGVLVPIRTVFMRSNRPRG